MKSTRTKAIQGVSVASDPGRRPSALASWAGKARKLTLVVPIDFCDPSRTALEFAGDFARRFGGRIVIVSVIQPDSMTRSERHPLIVSERTLRDRVVFKMSDLAKRHIGGDVLEKVLVCTGVPHERITETARRLKADFIIMATHGYRGLKHLLLGSTAERVIRFARCPVLTVHEQVQVE